MKQLPDLRGVMLEDCWVLGWSRGRTGVVFKLEASLWPEHPLYERARPGEWTCYKQALLQFADVEQVDGLASMEDVRPSVDPDGSKDYGNIELLSVTDDGYLISGEFGEVVIRAATCNLTFP